MTMVAVHTTVYCDLLKKVSVIVSAGHTDRLRLARLLSVQALILTLTLTVAKTCVFILTGNITHHYPTIQLTFQPNRNLKRAFLLHETLIRPPRCTTFMRCSLVFVLRLDGGYYWLT